MTTRSRHEVTPAPSRIRPFGWVLGQLLSAMGVQQDILASKGAKRRSVEKYLSGQYVSAAKADAIRQEVASQLAGLLPTSDILDGRMILSLLVHHEGAWERLVSVPESNGLALGSPRHLLIPFLRMATIDLSLRLGCWAALRTWDSDDRLPTLQPLGEWLSTQRCAKHLEGLLKGHLPELRSLESRAQEIGVSPQSLSEWLNGEATPSAESCIAVANAMEPMVLAPLLRARAGTALRLKLDSVTDAQVLCDCIAFSDQVVPRVQRIVLNNRSPDAEQSAMLFSIAMGGFLHPNGRILLRVLSDELDLNEEVRLDMAALVSGEIAVAGRVNFWLQQYATFHKAPTYFRSQSGGTEILVCEAVEAVLAHFETGRGYEMCAPGPQRAALLQQRGAARVVGFAQPVGSAGVALLISQSAELRDRGNRDGALAKAKQAVELDPTSADAYYNYGSLLGMPRLRPSKANLKAAESVIHIAIQLAPGRGDIVKELGVVLSNQRRHAEAEAAFARAAEVGARGEHYWVCRGRNLAAADDLAGALRCFDELLSAGKAPREAIELSAACLQLLGRKRDASNRWRKVHTWHGETKLDDCLARKLLNRGYRPT